MYIICIVILLLDLIDRVLKIKCDMIIFCSTSMCRFSVFCSSPPRFALSINKRFICNCIDHLGTSTWYFVLSMCTLILYIKPRVNGGNDRLIIIFQSNSVYWGFLS